MVNNVFIQLKFPLSFALSCHVSHTTFSRMLLAFTQIRRWLFDFIVKTRNEGRCWSSSFAVCLDIKNEFGILIQMGLLTRGIFNGSLFLELIAVHVVEREISWLARFARAYCKYFRLFSEAVYKISTVSKSKLADCQLLWLSSPVEKLLLLFYAR